MVKREGKTRLKSCPEEEKNLSPLLFCSLGPSADAAVGKALLDNFNLCSLILCFTLMKLVEGIYISEKWRSHEPIALSFVASITKAEQKPQPAGWMPRHHLDRSSHPATAVVSGPLASGAAETEACVD